jgi:hypothetical protein
MVKRMAGKVSNTLYFCLCCDGCAILHAEVVVIRRLRLQDSTSTIFNACIAHVFFLIMCSLFVSIIC